jgi:hypothetical protein
MPLALLIATANAVLKALSANCPSAKLKPPLNNSMLAESRLHLVPDKWCLRIFEGKEDNFAV